MYVYIANPAAGHGRLAAIQKNLERKLNSGGINGEILKTTGGDVSRLVQIALEQKARTIVVIGGDHTVRETVHALYQLARSMQKLPALGIIPIGDANTLATSLGIDSWQQGIKAVGARRLLEVPFIAVTAKHNDTMERMVFFQRLRLSGSKATPVCVTIDRSLRLWADAKDLEFTSPSLVNGARQQDVLRVTITTASSPDSSLGCREKVVIKADARLSCDADGKTVTATQLNIEQSPATLRLVRARGDSPVDHL